MERVTEAGATTEQTRELGLSYPLACSPLACRGAVSHERFPCTAYSLIPLRSTASAWRGGSARRARHVDRQPGFADSHVIQPILPYMLERIEQGITGNHP